MSPPLKINIARSTTTIADTAFPCIGVVCPDHPSHPQSDSARVLGGSWGPSVIEGETYAGWDAIIPTENKLLVHIHASNHHRGLEISIMHTVCEPYHFFEDDADYWVYLPMDVHLDGKTLKISGKKAPFAGGLFSWKDADPEWVVEFIERISCLPQPTRAAQVPLGGPKVSWVSLRELMALREKKGQC